MGKVTCFINNVMVGIEEKKEYDELVEEVLRGWMKMICRWSFKK